MPVVVLSLLFAAQTRAGEATTLHGSYASNDECFRVVAYGHGDATGLIVYGCITIDAIEHRYVAEAKNLRRENDTLYFELPPRRLSQTRYVQPGIAGHQSELPAQRVDSMSTSWRLTMQPDAMVLECTLQDPAGCGIADAVKLFPVR